jgi:hypothetical protein
MSLIGTVANYGGRQPDNFQGIKQFVVGADSLAIWVYKKLPSGLKVQTPADKIRPIYISTDLYVNGSIYNTSDIRLKENIEKISTLKINRLLDLKPVEYQFKSDTHQQIHYGFIAQEMEQVYPELVKKSELGYKRVNYIELIPLLVSKIQLMQDEINELKQQLGIKNIV